jgi:hypothetical protein
MKPAALALSLGTLLLAPPASPQQPPAALADVPSGPATIRGSVLGAEDDSPLAGVEVGLYALTVSGVPGVRHTKSDASGRFRFENISNDPHIAYLVGTRHQGIPFPGGRVSFGPGETEHVVEVRISETIEEASGIEVVESSLRLDRTGKGVAVTETHRLRNPSSKTAYVPGEGRNPEHAGFVARLPAQAEGFSMPLGALPEGLERREETIAFYGPFYPGEQELRFSYRLPATGGSSEIRKAFPSGAARVVVQVPRLGLQLRADRLQESGEAQVGGRSYRKFETGTLEAGGVLVLSVEVPPASEDPTALRLLETRLFLELDDAALLAREEHRFRVEADGPIVASASEPVLRLSLPEGAVGVRFSPNAVDFGLGHEANGETGLLGPIPAGESEIEVRYRLPAGEGTLLLERRFGKRLPLLSVFVADTGILAQSERLHRRRPVRTPDRTFLHLEAFEIAADERVALSLAPLGARASLPRGARIGLVMACAALVVFILIRPLGAPAQREGLLEAEAQATTLEEREAVYTAIRDLEHDYEMGKLSGDDYQALRHGLRVRAVTLLRAEREARSAVGAHAGGAPEVSTPCPGCGASGHPGDRFCARCGTRLAEGEPTAGAPA